MSSFQRQLCPGVTKINNSSGVRVRRRQILISATDSRLHSGEFLPTSRPVQEHLYFSSKMLDWQRFWCSRTPLKSSLRVLDYRLSLENKRKQQRPNMHQNTISDLPESDAEPTCGSARRAAYGGRGRLGRALFGARTNIPTAVQWRWQIITTCYKGIITCCVWPFWQIIHERCSPSQRPRFDDVLRCVGSYYCAFRSLHSGVFFVNILLLKSTLK